MWNRFLRLLRAIGLVRRISDSDDLSKVERFYPAGPEVIWHDLRCNYRRSVVDAVDYVTIVGYIYYRSTIDARGAPAPRGYGRGSIYSIQDTVTAVQGTENLGFSMDASIQGTNAIPMMSSAERMMAMRQNIERLQATQPIVPYGGDVPQTMSMLPDNLSLSNAARNLRPGQIAAMMQQLQIDGLPGAATAPAAVEEPKPKPNKPIIFEW